MSPPSPLYIQRDDILFVQASSFGVGGDTVRFIARLLLASPEVGGQPGMPPPDPIRAPGGPFTQIIKTIELDLVVTQNNTAFQSIQLAEGYLLSVAASSFASQQRGTTYAQADVQRVRTGQVNLAQPLFAEFISATQIAGWPGGNINSSAAGYGFVTSVQQANPAAGADWAIAVPASQRWRVQSFSSTFTASAAVANRNISVLVDDGANIVWQHDVSAAVTAGTAVSVNGSSTNAPVGVVATTLSVVLPPGLVLASNMRVRSLTANIQGADQWSAIWFLLEKWWDF